VSQKQKEIVLTCGIA